MQLFPTYTCNHSCYTIYVRFFATYTCVLPCFVGFLFPSTTIFLQKSPYSPISRIVSLAAVFWMSRNAWHPKKQLRGRQCARDNPEREYGIRSIHCSWHCSFRTCSLFFKEIWENGTRGYGCTFASAKGKQQKTPSCTVELKSNVSLNQAWLQYRARFGSYSLSLQ